MEANWTKLDLCLFLLITMTWLSAYTYTDNRVDVNPFNLIKSESITKTNYNNIIMT